MPIRARAPRAALSASFLTVSAFAALGCEHEEIHRNPPPPPSQISNVMNAKVSGHYLLSDGASCRTENDKAPAPCPDFMKDPAWKKCSDGYFYMSGDSARCFCKHPLDGSVDGNDENMDCPAMKPSPWPPSSAP